MGNEKIDPSLSRGIVNNSRFLEDAYIDMQQANAPKLFRKVVIDLSTERTLANPFKVSFSFKSIYVSTSSTTTDEINMIPSANEETSDLFPLRKKDVMNFDLPIKNAYFTNEAQASRSMTLLFALNSQFRPGSSLTSVTNAVEGTVITTLTPQVATTVADALVVANPNRSVLNISSDAPIWISENIGGEWFPIGTRATLKNTSQLFKKTLSGTANVYIMQES